MRLASVTLARDEADIIEPFIRHNLHFLDRMYVVDDGSSDATPRIIALLQAEGLPVEVVDDGSHASYRQGQRATALAAHAMAQEKWDFILPIDADEFIDATDRAQLESELAALPAPHAGSFSMTHYIPGPQDDLADPNPLSRITQVRNLPRGPNKVIVPGAIAGHPEMLISDGNHMLSHWHVEVPAVLTKSVDLAHFPIRSTDQLVAKCMISYMRWRARPDYTAQASSHLINGAKALAGEPRLTIDDPTTLLDAYLAFPSGPLVSRPFVNARGEMRYPDLANTYPYRRVLDGVDLLIEGARSSLGEIHALRQEMERTRAPFHAILAAAVRKHRRSFMRRWKSLTKT